MLKQNCSIEQRENILLASSLDVDGEYSLWRHISCEASHHITKCIMLCCSVYEARATHMDEASGVYVLTYIPPANVG